MEDGPDLEPHKRGRKSTDAASNRSKTAAKKDAQRAANKIKQNEAKKTFFNPQRPARDKAESAQQQPAIGQVQTCNPVTAPTPHVQANTAEASNIDVADVDGKVFVFV